ncbi:VOC family protein [Pedobacter sp. B4-66]|uniref:VOC family protein n=1 Tax=Pedobacter sp. B4-66 TaxID=2817280 RepID=UPI0032EB997E
MSDKKTTSNKKPMKVKRIVIDISTQDLDAAKQFYQEILGLELIMDHGWITSYGSDEQQRLQISFAKEGGSGAPIPDLSIEVDDIEEALQRMKEAKIPIEYGPENEPWGVRRFFVRDPFDKLINILAHI